MKPLFTSGKQITNYGFDVETFEVDGKQKFLFASIVDAKGDLVIQSSNKVAIISRMVHLAKSDNTTHFWATNLDYDIFELCKGTNYEKMLKPTYKGSQLICVRLNYQKRKNKKVLKNGEIKEYSSYRYVTFCDTLNIHKASVKHLGELIGIHKMESPTWLGQYPPTNADWDYLLEYNIQDSRVSVMFIEKVQELMQDIGQHILKVLPKDATPEHRRRCKNTKGRLRITTASMALDIFKRFFLWEAIDYPVKNLQDLYASYRGGRTECFIRGTYISNQSPKAKKKHADNPPLQTFDINAMYPSVMRKEFPHPNFLHYCDDPQFLSKIVKQYMGIAYVKMRTHDEHIPYLGVRHDTKLIFPQGIIEGWFTHFEINKAIKKGYTLLSLTQSHYYTQTWKPFAHYVEVFYTLRQQYKKKDYFYDTFFKLLLNSLYGRFAMKPFEQQEYITEEEMCPALLDEKQEDGFTVRMLDGPTYLAKKIDLERTNEDIVPIFSIYTTAYARDELYTYMMQVKDSLVYVDTDSVTSVQALKTSSKMGGMKLEKKMIEAMFIRPKCYAYKTDDAETVVKIKGIRGLYSGDINMHYENFCKMIRKKYAYTQERFIKYRQSKRIFRGKMHEVHERITETKNVDLEDTKRIWAKEFNPNGWQTSKPIILDEK